MADIRSGLLVFLIALPLCLGIAIASGFPPIAGLLTAIIGGLIPTFLGSSPLSIKGPAAGLIVVMVDAVSELGYEKCLAVGVAAAILQIIFSGLKASKIGKLMPLAVIHGMLAAIGVIIIAKQIHVLLGVLPSSKKPLQLIAEIPHSIMNANPEILALGLLTLAIVIAYPLLPKKMTEKVPASLMSLVFVLPLAIYWHLDLDHVYWFEGQSFEVGPKFLVTLPNQIWTSLAFPDFSALSTLVAWKYVIMLALIGSLESILTVMAIDTMNPSKHKSNLDKDLFSVGVGNLIASFIGGLPMISEVVRSKANIDSGAKSRWSNFYHGLFLLLAVTLLVPIIHEIPLSALAALLIITGIRLASPKMFVHMFNQGINHLLPFLITLFVTLRVDLLVGVFAGVVLTYLLNLIPHAKRVRSESR
ncbi:MAG: SulP family inorganic anion transporter [Myxococcota bacterium]